jgi:hypothetical protein
MEDTSETDITTSNMKYLISKHGIDIKSTVQMVYSIYGQLVNVRLKLIFKFLHTISFPFSGTLYADSAKSSKIM